MQTHERGFNMNLDTKKRMSMLNSMNEHFSLDSEMLLNQLLDEYEKQIKAMEEFKRLLEVVISRQVKAILEGNQALGADWEYIRIKLEEVLQ